MRALAVVGDEPPLEATADRLDGRVALVRAAERVDRASDSSADGGQVDETRTDADPSVDTDHSATDRLDTDRTEADRLDTYRLDADGAWRGTTSGEGFGRLLDRLAPEYDYALIAGTTRLRLPTIVVGERSVAGRVVHRPATTPDPATLAATIREVEPHVTLETLVAETKRAADEAFAGAIATFTGRVRAKNDPDDTRTTHLSFEKYDGVAADRLDRIERELTDRDGVYDVRTHHRTGVIEAGEDIVFVVVLAGHRDEAFRTVSDGIDRLKEEVPIFKKEVTTEDAFWRHERDA